MPHNLFAYGSLKDPDVYFQVTGVRGKRKQPARLIGYALGKPVEGYPAIVANEQGEIDGEVIYGIGDDELTRLDEYEGEGYRRVTVSLEINGAPIDAFAYIRSNRV